MSTNRYLRILGVLVGVKCALGIVPLTAAVNRRFGKAYAPSLLGSDLKALIAREWVKISDARTFSITCRGKDHFASLSAEEVIALCEALAPDRILVPAKVPVPVKPLEPVRMLMLSAKALMPA